MKNKRNYVEELLEETLKLNYKVACAFARIFEGISEKISNKTIPKLKFEVKQNKQLPWKFDLIPTIKGEATK